MQGGKEERSLVVMALLQAMCRIASPFGLYEAGVISDAVEIKMLIIGLYHGMKSVESLTSFLCSPGNDWRLSEETMRLVGSVFPREDRKLVKRLKPLRDAFVHYDFSRFPVCVDSDGLVDPSEQLHSMFEICEDKDAIAFASEIGECAANVLKRISNITGVPIPAYGHMGFVGEWRECPFWKPYLSESECAGTCVSPC